MSTVLNAIKAKNALLAAFILITLAPTCALAGLRVRELKDPAPIAVNPERNALQLIYVARNAADSSKYGWHFDTSKGMDKIQGGYRIGVVKEWGNYAIYAHLTATSNAISLSYADSKNLNFEESKDGKREIHKAYNDYTELLMQEISQRLTKLCPDLSGLAGKEDTGVTFPQLSQTMPTLRTPKNTETIAGTNYVIRGYEAFYEGVGECGNVSAVFLNDKFHSVHAGDASLASLQIKGELITQEYESGKITYGQAATKFKEAELDYSDWFEPIRQKQLLSYYRLQSSRLDKKEITAEEFDYSVVEKEAELQGQQESIARKDVIDRSMVAAEREKAAAMQEQAAAARAANFQNFLNGLKSVTCSSYAIGNTATTTCR